MALGPGCERLIAGITKGGDEAVPFFSAAGTCPAALAMANLTYPCRPNLGGSSQAGLRWFLIAAAAAGRVLVFFICTLFPALCLIGAGTH